MERRPPGFVLGGDMASDRNRRSQILQLGVTEWPKLFT
jgi:hypothetical protein